MNQLRNLLHDRFRPESRQVQNILYKQAILYIDSIELVDFFTWTERWTFQFITVDGYLIGNLWPWENIACLLSTITITN